MLFRAAASVALVACVSHAAAEPKPYKLAVMPVLGMSLMRRDTSGYQPEETQCHEGNTCAEACGDGFTQCPSTDDAIHCFNPAAAQSCCSDGSGNSCDAGYYCTHDTSLETWCCPDSMDLAACAAAYSVTGGLETPEPTTSTPTSTSTPPPTTSTTSTSTTTTSSSTTTKTKVTTSETTTSCASSSGYSTVWTAVNSTISTLAPTQPAETVTELPVTSTTTGPPPPVDTSGASANAVSALLVLAAGAVAFL
jgi:hypothetical protein